MFARGQHVVLFGPVEMRGHGGLQLTNPQYEILDDEDGETIHTGRIVPVYEKTGSVTPKMQRRLVHDACSGCRPTLPDHAARAAAAPPATCRRAAPRSSAAHFPPADAAARRAEPVRDAARSSGLIFEEAFLFQMGVLARRQAAAAEQKPATVTRRRSHPRIGAARCCRSG